MRFYGDRARSAFAGAALDALAERLAEVRAAPPGLSRHACLVGALIEAAALHQGGADLELAQRGVDDDSIAQQAGFQVVAALARSVAASWDDPARAPCLDIDELLARWRDVAPAERLSLRVAEGCAHYAVYPEAYLEAARGAAWSATPQIIGLRSIGVALAAIVSAAFEDNRPLAAVRPMGAPFSRRLALGARLSARLLDHAGPYAVVDEGPGLSGSSFGAVGDLLHAEGVALDHVVYLPSHDGAPGAMASPEHRQRWTGARRLVADFDSRIGVSRLGAWMTEAHGPLSAPLRDLSGGVWRTGSAPVIPMLERRKFLAETRDGPWLLKFAGLGAEGEAKAERARALATAGFSPAVGGLLHGFIAQRWVANTHPLELAQWGRDRLLDHLAGYLSFRARRFPAQREDSADLEALADMARVNAAEALGEAAGRAVEQRLKALLVAAPPGRPVHVDGRLHVWEWLVSPTGELLKVDAVDHSCGHDLVGCQDIAWDVAGAELELELSEAETKSLARSLGVAPGLLAIHRACYPAFQLGLWSFAPAEEATRVEAHVRRYREALRRFADLSTIPGENPWMEHRRRAT